MNRYLVSTAIFLVAAPVFAQNLNPKVQVVNDYDASVTEASKSGVDMALPDSLLRFDYKFDYGIFDSAYGGAYDVSQYFVNTRPAAVPDRQNSFLLNLGAGYNLRPELNLDWQAVQKGRYELGLSNDFGGAYGAFSSVSGNKDFTGYDFGENFELSNVWRLDKSLLKANVAYDGIYNSLEFAEPVRKGYNSAKLEFTAESPANSIRNFYYNVGLQYRYANDNCGELGALDENYFKLSGKLGPTVRSKYRVLVDFAFEYDANSGCVKSDATMFHIKPNVGMAFGIFNMLFGLDLAYSSKPGDSTVSPGFGIFPDVRMRLRVLDDYLNVFAGVTGEQKMLSYSGFKFREHAYQYDFGMLGASYNEWINAFFGLSGHASNAFEYLVKAGYVLTQGKPFAAYDLNASLPAFTGVNYHKAYAMAMLGWNDERIESDLTFNFNKCWFIESTVWPNGLAVFNEPAFELKANFTYNWNRRIFAGVMCEWRSAAEVVGLATYRETPSFVNLGLKARYMFDEKFGIWLKGANLLNQELWYSDFYARKGVECTLGITLTL